MRRSFVIPLLVLAAVVAAACTSGDGDGAASISEGWSATEIGPGTKPVLALDAQGAPHVAFSDESLLRYATRTDDGWEVEDIVSAGDRPLGQLASLKLDALGTPH